ncbi:unnamed protein product [Notodromas monacha]|uniref:Uncharacterized protein n=1 Tax=Notodromas monacha TaxID=399045 RepID=A0A7R9BLK3_9CRUS|nr:unnamed protein product [Notodromas monacha]CAG0917727.1 unnamed protein product [Notodromas monacha]
MKAFGILNMLKRRKLIVSLSITKLLLSIAYFTSSWNIFNYRNNRVDEIEKCLSVFQSNGSLKSDLKWELSHCKLKIFPQIDSESCLKRRFANNFNNRFFFFGDSTIRIKAMALAKFFNLTLDCKDNCDDFRMVIKMHWDDADSNTTIDYLLNPFFNPYTKLPEGTPIVLFGGAAWFSRPPEHLTFHEDPYFDLLHLPIPVKLEIHKDRLDRLLNHLITFWKIQTIIWILPETMHGNLTQYNEHIDTYIQQSLDVISKYRDNVIVWSSWRMFFDQFENTGRFGTIMRDDLHVKDECQLHGMQPLLNFLCNPVDETLDSDYCCHKSDVFLKEKKKHL